MPRDLYELGQSQQKDIQSIGEEVRIDLQLDENPYLQTGTVTGIVTDESGNPIEGALVKILDKNHNPLYHALSNSDGRYIIEDINPESELHLHAIKTGYLMAGTIVISMSQGQTLTEDITLVVDPDAAKSTIAGHVVDINGNPVENVLATLIKVEGETETEIGTTTTNEYGQYAFVYIDIGSYKVRLSGQGYKTTEVEVQVTEPSSIVKIETTIQIAPEQSNGTINGIITDDDGDPVVGGTVILYEVTGDPENPILTPVRYTKTIEGGTYLFGNVPQGSYIVKANKEQ